VSPVSTWYHHTKPDRGKRKPRVYSVSVTYDREQADFEAAARRLGLESMSGFFVLAARVLLWLHTEAAFRDEEAEARREQERLDHAEKVHQDRRERTRQEREARQLAERERDIWRQEQELKLRAEEGKT
jgi:hypothetical protein